MPLRDSLPAQKNEEEVQENKSSRHNSVTAAVSNGQTTSEALTEVENKQHFAESQSTVSHLFARTRWFTARSALFNICRKALGHRMKITQRSIPFVLD